MKCVNPLIFSVLTLGIFSSSSFAGEVILDRVVLEQASRQARENPYRLKLAIGSKEILYFEVGKPVTPYFRDESDTPLKRRFQSENRCYEVSFFKKLNLARKTNCLTVMDDLKLPGLPDFHAARVSELLQESLNAFDFWNTSATYSLTGFVHDRETIRMDQIVLNIKDQSSFPTRSFTVKTSSSGKVVLDSKAGLVIEQHYLLTLGKIGILNERSIKIDSSIKRSLDQWVFTDGQGKIVLINALMAPLALQNFTLGIQPEFIRYLKDLETKSSQGAVCYRDSWTHPSDQDCHFLLTQKIQPVGYSPFRLLRVDFHAGTVEPIQ